MFDYFTPFSCLTFDIPPFPIFGGFIYATWWFTSSHFISVIFNGALPIWSVNIWVDMKHYLRSWDQFWHIQHEDWQFTYLKKVGSSSVSIWALTSVVLTKKPLVIYHWMFTTPLKSLLTWIPTHIHNQHLNVAPDHNFQDFKSLMQHRLWFYS